MSRRRVKDEQLGGEHEDYPTPSWCTDLLEGLGWIPPRGMIVEPTAGEGALVRRLLHAHPERSIVACNIADTRGQLAESGADHVRIGDVLSDAMRGELLPERRRLWPFDAVCTNPPFSIAGRVIDLGLELAPLVVMLLPMTYFGSDEREAWFAATGHPEEIAQFSNRPQFRGEGSNSVEYAWCLWTRARRRSSKFYRLQSIPKADRAASRERDSAEIDEIRRRCGLPPAGEIADQ